MSRIEVSEGLSDLEPLYTAHRVSSRGRVDRVARRVGLPEAHANTISGSRPTLYRHRHLVRKFVGVSRWNTRAQRQVENTIETLAVVRTHAADLLIGAIERLHRDVDTLRAASNDLINVYASFELPGSWGSRESAAADGTLVPTYDDNLMDAYHVRYGRTSRIAYRHVADNIVAIFSHFIPCGVHEAVFIPDAQRGEPG